MRLLTTFVLSIYQPTYQVINTDLGVIYGNGVHLSIITYFPMWVRTILIISWNWLSKCIKISMGLIVLLYMYLCEKVSHYTCVVVACCRDECNNFTTRRCVLTHLPISSLFSQISGFYRLKNSSSHLLLLLIFLKLLWVALLAGPGMLSLYELKFVLLHISCIKNGYLFRLACPVTIWVKILSSFLFRL